MDLPPPLRSGPCWKRTRSRQVATGGEFAGYVPSGVPGKAVHGEVSHQSHCATKLLGLLLEKLQVLQEPVAGEATLVSGVGPGEKPCPPQPGERTGTRSRILLSAVSFLCPLDKA